LTRTRQRSGGAALIAALEAAWDAIRSRHPELPVVQILVGPGSSGRSSRLLLGHHNPGRWQRTTDSQLVDELLISGEGLARGAEDVFCTQLHEAAHVLARARDIADTSRDGRYHNHRYRDLAIELGLHVARDPVLGWSTTTLPDATRAGYAAAISAIADAITVYRIPEPIAGAGRSLTAAVCGCPRRIRVAACVLYAGAITCELCHQAFTARTADQVKDRGA